MDSTNQSPYELLDSQLSFVCDMMGFNLADISLSKERFLSLILSCFSQDQSTRILVKQSLSTLLLYVVFTLLLICKLAQVWFFASSDFGIFIDFFLYFCLLFTYVPMFGQFILSSKRGKTQREQEKKFQLNILRDFFMKRTCQSDGLGNGNNNQEKDARFSPIFFEYGLLPLPLLSFLGNKEAFGVKSNKCNFFFLVHLSFLFTLALINCFGIVNQHGSSLLFFTTSLFILDIILFLMFSASYLVVFGGVTFHVLFGSHVLLGMILHTSWFKESSLIAVWSCLVLFCLRVVIISKHVQLYTNVNYNHHNSHLTMNWFPIETYGLHSKHMNEVKQIIKSEKTPKQMTHFINPELADLVKNSHLTQCPISLSHIVFAMLVGLLLETGRIWMMNSQHVWVLHNKWLMVLGCHFSFTIVRICFSSFNVNLSRKTIRMITLLFFVQFLIDYFWKSNGDSQDLSELHVFYLLNLFQFEFNLNLELIFSIEKLLSFAIISTLKTTYQQRSAVRAWLVPFLFRNFFFVCVLLKMMPVTVYQWVKISLFFFIICLVAWGVRATKLDWIKYQKDTEEQEGEEEKNALNNSVPKIEDDELFGECE